MSFEKFFRIIDATKFGDFVSKKQSAIEDTDPAHIYVENVRSFFGVSHAIAKGMCELAVRQGLFEKRQGVLCPQHRQIIAEKVDGSQFEPIVICSICESLGLDNFRYSPLELDQIEFYRLCDNEHAHATD